MSTDLALLASLEALANAIDRNTEALNRLTPPATHPASLKINPGLTAHVDELELSARASNCLRSNDIKTIGDLVQRSEAEILRLPNLGRLTLNEIKEVLAQIGLHFRPHHQTNTGERI